MKLLDRYVVGSFLRNYLTAFLVVVGMRIVLHMILQFDELWETNAKTGTAGVQAVWVFLQTSGTYYFYQSFLYFAQMAGLIPVVAAAFTLLRMARFNEMGALLSSGVPAQRVAMPIFLVAILLQGLLWVDQELLMPRMPQIDWKPDYAAEKDYFPIRGMRDEHDGKLFAGAYYAKANPPRMEQISIVTLDEAGRGIHIRAARATWDGGGGRWLLEDGHLIITDTGARTSATTKPLTQTPLTEYRSDVTPAKIRLFRSGESVDLLSTDQINELLKRPMSYGRDALLRVKYSRGPAQIATNMVVLLLAISTLLTRDPQHLWIVTMRCIFWCGACLTMAMTAQMMRCPSAALADRWPAMMAWLPVFFYGPIAVILLGRVKT
jgi:lipopolysaccharide export system permease protein